MTKVMRKHDTVCISNIYSNKYGQETRIVFHTAQHYL